MARADGRGADELRPVSFEVGVQSGPAGSVLVSFGNTRVICAVSYDNRPPRWKARGGWVTAEYAMLPGAGHQRTPRDRRGPGGRSKEIERLIGRSLRAAVDLDRLPQCTLTVDCDVLQADGGTRTAAITGGWVALTLALRSLDLADRLTGQVAAVSVGVVDGQVWLDLPYEEDVRAEVDTNVVMTADGRFVEVQGTAEGPPFERQQLDDMLALAAAGCGQLVQLQSTTVGPQ